MDAVAAGELEAVAPAWPDNQEAVARQLFETDWELDAYRVALSVLDDPVDGKGSPLKEIIPRISGELEAKVADGKIYGVILHASKSPLSPVRSGGPWRGYYLDWEKAVDQAVSSAEGGAEVEETVEVGDKKLYERNLYPLVALWLKIKKECGRVSHDVANMRGGGVWSNPDVVALNPMDRMGFFDVEIISAEVKPSDIRWRQYIFEAVSHRRYVDRSYFVYRSKNGISSFDPEMLRYAEKFHVGIAVIDLPDERVENLLNWDIIGETDRLELVDAVTEIVPAPSDVVSVRDKCEFLANIKVRQKDEIHAFGE